MDTQIKNTANYRVSSLIEEETVTGEENRAIEPALPSIDSTEINNPVSVQLEDNIAYSFMSWRQCQTTQPQEHEEDLSSETDQEIGPESIALELQRNAAYSAMPRGQSQATQQQKSQESISSRRNHEVSPESSQMIIAYSSTFWR